MRSVMMKIIVLTLFLIQSLIYSSAKTVEAQQLRKPANKENKQAEAQVRMDKWETDSNTILKIISGLRNIEPEDPNDSNLQREHKAKLRKKKYNKELKRIKKEYYNKPFSLQAVMVEDVKPETRLNKTGRKKQAEMERAFRTGHPYRDYLAVQFAKNRYKYEVETGNYEIYFVIPVPESGGYSTYSHGIKKTEAADRISYTEDSFNVNIILVVKSKIKALQYSKEDVVSLTGKIKNIKHGYTFMDEYVTIRLVE